MSENAPHDEVAQSVKIGKAIRDARLFLNLDLGEFAEICHVSELQLVRVEQGSLRDEGLRKAMVQALKNRGFVFEDGIEGLFADE